MNSMIYTPDWYEAMLGGYKKTKVGTSQGLRLVLTMKTGGCHPW
jgi:hypothetical protein